MDAVRVARDGPVAVLEMARPETGNALDGALVEALVEALAALPGSGARAAVLSGAGRHFSTGANLSELAPDAPLADRLADARRLGDLYATLLRCPLLTVAAVHGAAYGGGFGLAAACDLVIAAPDARLQFSELRLGFVPALISVFLPRRVVGTRLAQLFFDPSPLGAAAAQAVGLVDEVADDPRRGLHPRAVDRRPGVAERACRDQASVARPGLAGPRRAARARRAGQRRAARRSGVPARSRSVPRHADVP
jgi:methylglutaconyl-CoA hydratase